MKEKLQIKVGLKPTFKYTPTNYKIYIDDTLMIESQPPFSSRQVLEHIIDAELDKGIHYLNIRIFPTNLQFENIEILKVSFNDQTLREIDLFLLSEYLLDEPRIIDGVKTDKIEQCTCIGWRGVYRIKFSIPIVPFLLKHII